MAAGDGVVPLRYAAQSPVRQRQVAQRIVDLRLLRDLQATAAEAVDQAALVASLAEELATLEAPFRDRHVHQRFRGPGTYDEDGADYDEAAFLRQFDGEPGLAGDILVAQVEARLAGPLFGPLLGLSDAELRRATDWWASLGTVEFAGFAGATRRIADFYTRAGEVLEGLLPGAEEAREEIEELLPLLRERSEQFAGVDADVRVFGDAPPTLIARIGPVTVPVRAVQVAAAALRAVTGRGRSGPPPPQEEEPPEPTAAL